MTQLESHAVELPPVQTGDESLIILESLLCVMREKNLLSRQDLELLCQKVDRRAAGISKNPLPCCPDKAANARNYLQRLSAYLGQRYGGKHLRRVG
ncbi:hypothetical protein [Sphingomonas azotifigens]|uniref:hypothetical protein n=1 Tax=Sphingomonas azotifigens TaxID=330920 RepID=UPI001FE8FAB2|nr:hypothetical protein [Sphingomonas azotifigens]